MSSADILRDMIDNVDDQTDHIGVNVGQIQDQIDDLQEQYDAIEDGVTDVTTNELTDYLTNTKLPEFQLIVPEAVLEFGPDYNKIEYGNALDDWRIVDASANILYEYNGIGWDSDQVIIDLMDEWDFGNDYLTRPLTSGASYGLGPYISNLNTAKGILNENSSKLTDSKTVFERFAS